MKRIWLTLLLIYVMCIGAISVSAAQITETIPLGTAKEKFDWAQGLTVVGDTYYVLDGNEIRVRKQGKWNTVFGLGSLKSQLPHELQDDMVIRSFRLTDMKHRNGSLFLSGLVYKDRQNEHIPYPSGGHAAGETYTLLFQIENGHARILHLKSAGYNRQMQPDDFYETESGGPENLYKWAPGVVLYNYAQYIYKPQFTFADNGAIVMVRSHVDEGDTYKYRQVVLLDDNKETVLYELRNPKKLLRGNREQGNWASYSLPILKGNTLFIYDGTVFVYSININTKETKVDELSDVVLMERPILFNGNPYFLDNTGVFSWQRNGPYYDFIEILQAKDFGYSVLISDWDYDGKNVYILSYDKRTIYKIRP